MIVSESLASSNGGRLVTNMNKITPKLQISERKQIDKQIKVIFFSYQLPVHRTDHQAEFPELNMPMIHSLSIIFFPERIDSKILLFDMN